MDKLLEGFWLQAPTAAEGLRLDPETQGEVAPGRGVTLREAAADQVDRVLPRSQVRGPLGGGRYHGLIPRPRPPSVALGLGTPSR